MEDRIHIEDYDIQKGYAWVLIGSQSYDFNFSLSQAIEGAIDLKYILEPLKYDNAEVIMTHPLFSAEMTTEGVERKCTVPTISVLKELSGEEQNELVRYLAVQELELLYLTPQLKNHVSRNYNRLRRNCKATA